MKILIVKPVNSNSSLIITGDNYKYDPKNKIHYLDGQSYPSSIVCNQKIGNAIEKLEETLGELTPIQQDTLVECVIERLRALDFDTLAIAQEVEENGYN